MPDMTARERVKYLVLEICGAFSLQEDSLKAEAAFKAHAAAERMREWAAKVSASDDRIASAIRSLPLEEE